MKKLWGGRFADGTSDIAERMSVSVHYDKRLFEQDIRGSLAHAEMLARQGIISGEDLSLIRSGLATVLEEIRSGAFEFSESLEDIHMNIESRLSALVGDAGKRLHTARSRNDQVATDTRLYLRDEIVRVRALLVALIATLVDCAEKHQDVIMPGYTHLQVAQPVRFSHHLLAHAWSLLRDLRRLDFAGGSLSECPLGSGALAGVNYPTDRFLSAELLGFTAPTPNSMDSVADRDYMLDFLYFCTVVAQHLSRMAEELVLWSGSEFSYIRLSDRVTTGSSIMPQKKNPDLAELVRGKTGRVYGNLFSLLTVLKGLPMTYNRDLQEDKEPLFDSIDTVSLCLEAMGEMFAEMEVNREAMRRRVYANYITATDLADYLAAKGVPFRVAHEVVGSIVRFCEEEGRDFFALTVADLRSFSEVFEDDAVECLNPERSTERKRSYGYTSADSVSTQISMIRKALASQ